MQKFSHVRSLLPWAITIIAVAVLIFQRDSLAQRPAVVNPGRYQLFNGTYYSNVNGSINEANGLFKIDTETGATWFYMSRRDDKATEIGWVQTPTLARKP